MFAIPRSWAMLIGLVLALVAIPAALASASPALEGGGAMIILFAEIVIYFLAALFAAGRTTAVGALTVAVTFFVLRLVGCLAAVPFFPPVAGGGVLLAAWAGNPVAVILQMLLLMTLGGHVLAGIAPSLLEDGARESLNSGDKVARPAPRPADTPIKASATGGFVQVFSYEELAAQLRKTQGLEGFILFSAEGLVVWRDLPMRIEVDGLVARTLSLTGQMGHLVESSGLARVRRVMIESKEHFLFTTSLSSNFGLLLVFNSRVPPEDILARVGFVSKTAREFLQWKYPALTLAAPGAMSLGGGSMDAIPKIAGV